MMRDEESNDHVKTLNDADRNEVNKFFEVVKLRHQIKEAKQTMNHVVGIRVDGHHKYTETGDIIEIKQQRQRYRSPKPREGKKVKDSMAVNFQVVTSHKANPVQEQY